MLAANLLAMHNAEIDINDADLELGLNLDMGQFNNAVEPNSTFIGFKYLNPDSDYSDFNDPESYYELSLLFQRPVRNTDFFIGLGVKLNYIDTKNDTFNALPLMITGGYNLRTAIPITFNAEVAYAPKVLSFNDAQGYYEYRISADFHVIDNAEVYVGYRDMETKFEGTSFYKYNGAGYVGFRFHF